MLLGCGRWPGHFDRHVAQCVDSTHSGAAMKHPPDRAAQFPLTASADALWPGRRMKAAVRIAMGSGCRPSQLDRHIAKCVDSTQCVKQEGNEPRTTRSRIGT